LRRSTLRAMSFSPSKSLAVGDELCATTGDKFTKFFGMSTLPNLHVSNESVRVCRQMVRVAKPIANGYSLQRRRERYMRRATLRLVGRLGGGRLPQPVKRVLK